MIVRSARSITPPLALMSSIAIWTASWVSRPTWSWTAVGTPIRIGLSCACAGAWARRPEHAAATAAAISERRFIEMSPVVWARDGLGFLRRRPVGRDCLVRG